MLFKSKHLKNGFLYFEISNSLIKIKIYQNRRMNNNKS